MEGQLAEETMTPGCEGRRDRGVGRGRRGDLRGAGEEVGAEIDTVKSRITDVAAGIDE